MGLRDKKTTLVALGVFFFALIVRLFGIGWGLPDDLHDFSYHPDEPVIFGYSQQIQPTKLDFTPGFYNYGTFYLTVLRIATDMADAYGAGPKNESEHETWMAVGRYHLAGRMVSALAGAATALVVFLLLLPRANLLGALMGAGALALAPGHVVHSRFQTVDVLATFLLALSLYFAVKFVEDESAGAKCAVFAGLFAGLSAGTKYTGILALVSLAVACALSKKPHRWSALAFGTLASIVAFVIVTPGCLLDSQKFFQDFAYEMAHTSEGHGLVFADTPSGFLYHWANLFIAVGPAIVVLGALGIARACQRKHAWAIVLTAFFVAYFVLIGRAEVKFMRYVFPLVPVIAVGFGWIVSRAHESPRASLRFVVMFFAIMGLGGVFGGGAMRTATYTAWMSGPDPRDVTATELGGATSVGVVSDPWYYTPPYYPQTGLPRAVPFEKRKSAMDASLEPPVVQYVPANADDRFDWDVRLLKETRPEYVVFSSFETEGLDRLVKLPSPPAEFKTQIERAEEFMDTLSTRYALQKVHGADAFGLPHDLRYIRPEIQVWKIKADSSTERPGSSTTSPSSGAPAATP